MLTSSNLVDEALVSVLAQNIEARKKFPVMPTTTEAKRELLGDILIGYSSHWKEETLTVLDRIWKQEIITSRRTTLLRDVPLAASTSWDTGNTKVAVWQGDITSLTGVDAVINAANDQGLGCFVPSHKCIDNVIHRAAGPRLREACRMEMNQRGTPLTAGTMPIVTAGFHLPAKYVIHVTGPMIERGTSLTTSNKEALAQTYRNILETAANHSLKSIAIPCISTGLFGFPQEEAAEIALTTVHRWIHMNPDKLETIVFNTFLDKDMHLYTTGLAGNAPTTSPAPQATAITRTVTSPPSDPRSDSIVLAKSWIEKADSVLIVAGAGMSVKEGEMVYVKPDDFARHYPWFTKWGYRTNYETMGLSSDPTVPETAKWALHAKHMDNMRWKWAPNEGYSQLRQLVSNKDYFVLTSNVDACFERAGFDADRIYTPQGEWTYLQCMRACRPDSVFEARPYLDKILPHISSDGYVPENLIPHCPRCGGSMFGNVRGGSWFLHHERYQTQNEKLQLWMEHQKLSGKEVVVVEVGAGYNTPTVTRFPAETFVRSLQQRGKLIRINPSDPEVPGDLRSVALGEGWQALGDILHTNVTSLDAPGRKTLEAKVRKDTKNAGLMTSHDTTRQIVRYFGRDGWRKLLQQLRSRHAA